MERKKKEDEERKRKWEEKKRLEEEKKKKEQAALEEKKRKEEEEEMKRLELELKRIEEEEKMLEEEEAKEKKIAEEELKMIEKEGELEIERKLKEEEEKARKELEEQQRKEMEEIERKQKEEEKKLEQIKAIVGTGANGDAVTVSEKFRKRDEMESYVLRVNLIQLRAEGCEYFKCQMETKQTTKQEVTIPKVNQNIGKSLFFKEINDYSVLTIKAVEGKMKINYPEITIPLKDLELNEIVPQTAKLEHSTYPAELEYNLQLISANEGMKQTAKSTQNFTEPTPREGVFFLRLNTVRGHPPLKDVTGIYAKVTVGKQKTVQTPMFLPMDLNWNHFMSFDCDKNDMVKIEFFVRKKSFFSEKEFPYGQLTISMKGVKEQIQQK